MNDEEAIRTAVKAWKTGVDEFVERLAADIEFHAPPGFPDGDLVEGSDAVGTLLREMFGSVFTGVEYSLEDTTRGPDGWLLRARQSVDQQRGMKLEWEEFVDAAERQAGLDA